MSTQGKIKTLFSDKEKTEALFPRTKINAVSDENGKGLNAILDDMAYVGDITEDVTSTPVNADLLGGRPADEYATQNYVANEIAKAQLEGEDVDLSGYATKDEMNAAIRAIDYPVDSVNGRTGAITLSASDVGAAPDGILPQQATGNLVSVINSGDASLHGLKIYGKTTQNGTPTPENPVELVSVGKSGAINTTVCGKNLLANNANTATISGITFTVNADGSVTVNGTNNGSASAILNLCEFAFKKGEQYVLSGLTGSTVTKMHIWTQSANAFPVGSRLQCYDGEVTRTAQADETCVIRIQVEPSATINNVTIFPILRLASITDSTYEPYKCQTLTAQTPNGLPGIPVSSGGNYTDENGQQWICDYRDYTRRKYIQNVLMVQLTSAMKWAKNFAGTRIYTTLNVDTFIATDSPLLCSHAVKGSWHTNVAGTISLGNSAIAVCGFSESDFDSADALKSWLDEQAEGVFVLVPLNTPIETDLTAEEMAAYAALHTNYPNTTVYNDAGAHMEVEYYSPISAVPVDMGEGAKGKALVVDENGHVAPMKLTAAEIGAAPAGFGLGDRAIDITGKNLNDYTKWGVYYWGGTHTNAPFDWGYMEVIPSNGEGVTQVARKIGYVDGTVGIQVQRTMNEWGTWGEWEWVNPPMVPGVEYRTTERWNDKAVYTKLMHCGTLTNGAEVALPSHTSTIRHQGLFGYEAMPVAANGGGFAKSEIKHTDSGWVLSVSADTSNLGAWQMGWLEHIWYIKD